jgi:hypothetical protein
MLFSCTSVFSCTVPTSAYPRHYPGHWLLGGSLPSEHPAWPPAPIAERAIDGLLRSVRPFSVTLGPTYRRYALYTAPLVSSEYHVSAYTTWPNGGVSLLGLRVTAVSQVPTHDAVQPAVARAFVENPDHSHLFGASPQSASAGHAVSALSPFTPCTPTFDSQSLAVG